MDVETLLTCTHSEILALTPDQWQDVPVLLLASLSEKLAIPLRETGTIYPEPGEVQPGVTLSFQSPAMGDAGLGLQIEGIMGLQSDPDQTAVTASLFLFLDGVRIRVPEHDFYELKLKLATHGVEWCPLGWQEDVYGEFNSVQKWGDLSRGP